MKTKAFRILAFALFFFLLNNEFWANVRRLSPWRNRVVYVLMQMLAFHYQSINVASEKKFLKHERDFFFFHFYISSSQMELTDISKPILWAKKKKEKLQPKSIFIQEGIFSLKYWYCKKDISRTSRLPYVWWDQEINSAMKSYSTDWHS